MTETGLKSVVALQIIATALCHTDAHPINPKFKEALLPVILGHEGAGIVESVGPGVTNFKPGMFFPNSNLMEMSG